jgi:hypothetical protein
MTTRAPLTVAEIQYIAKRKQSQASTQLIATELHCSIETIRKHARRLRRQESARPRGRPPTGILSTFAPVLRETAVALKRQHPHWGPANVRLDLQKQLDLKKMDLPSLSSLAALFQSACPEAVQPHRPRHYPAKPPARVSAAHQRWEIDGKEKVPVGLNDVATILDIVDPFSSVFIVSRAHLTTTPKGWRKLERSEIQDTLRQAFQQWGLPHEIQTDHEVVYTGSPSADFPSDFTLWLVGLNMTHVTSRDHCPTDQPHTERSHRTMGDLGYKDHPAATLAQLQVTLDQSNQRYNHDYPSQAGICGGRPPLIAHPAAHHSGRPFQADLEWWAFDMSRVDAYLASYVWQRQVSDSGLVGLGNQHYRLGCRWAKQKIAARFIVGTRTFRFETSAGQFITELPARGLSKADLIGCQPLALIPPPLAISQR